MSRRTADRGGIRVLGKVPSSVVPTLPGPVCCPDGRCEARHLGWWRQAQRLSAVASGLRPYVGNLDPGIQTSDGVSGAIGTKLLNSPKVLEGSLARRTGHSRVPLRPISLRVSPTRLPAVQKETVRLPQQVQRGAARTHRAVCGWLRSQASAQPGSCIGPLRAGPRQGFRSCKGTRPGRDLTFAGRYTRQRRTRTPCCSFNISTDPLGGGSERSLVIRIPHTNILNSA